jgi:hypothetical protein
MEVLSGASLAWLPAVDLWDDDYVEEDNDERLNDL